MQSLLRLHFLDVKFKIIKRGFYTLLKKFNYFCKNLKIIYNNKIKNN